MRAWRPTPCALLAAVFMVAVAPARGQDDASVLRDYYTGNGLLNRQMYELAVPEYRKFLTEHPDHDKAPVARYGLAVSLFRLGRLEEAVGELTRLRERPGFEYAAEVLVLLGQSQLALDQPEDAAATLGDLVRNHSGHEMADEATALQAEALYEAGRHEQVEGPCKLLAARWPDSPHRPRAELFGGLAEMARGDDEAAARRFEALLGEFPEGEHVQRASLLLAQCLHRTGSWSQAVARYRAVIESAAPAYVADATYGLAILQQRRGRPDDAGRLLDRFLAEYPDHELAGAARLARGRVWFDREEYDRALEFFAEVGGSDPALGAAAAYWTAKCALRRGRADDAARGFAEALNRYPDSELAPQMAYDRAVALSRAGDQEGALAALVEFRLQRADHELMPDAMHLMAATLYQQSRFNDSLDVCRAFLRRYSAHVLEPAVAFLAAENMFLLKDYEAAAEAYRALLRRAPDHDQADRARYRLGLSLHHLQRFEESKRILASVTDGRNTAPDFRTALLAVGDGHFQRGEWAQAERSLGDYVAFGPDQPSADEALFKLGLAQQRQGKNQTALESFDRLINEFDRSPHQPHALFERGQLLADLGRTDEASAAFTQVLEEGSASPFAGHALNHLGSMARTRGDHVAAASYFGRAAAAFSVGDQAPEAADAGAEALFQQGQSLLAARQYNEAARVLEQLARDHPEAARLAHARALRAIARARQDGRSAQSGLVAIREVEGDYGHELDPSVRTALLYEKAWCLRDLGRNEEAAAAYRSMLQDAGSGPSLTYGMLELAELEVEAKRYEAAADLLVRLRHHAATDPGVPRDVTRKATYNLGVCEYHLGHAETASELLEAYLRDDPDPAHAPSASLLAAEAHYTAGRHQRAIGFLQGALDGDPPDDVRDPALLRLGECHAALQQWAASEEAFATYLDLYPDSTFWYQARFGVGWARENQGRYDEAIESYREVVGRHQGMTAARAQFQIGECLFAQERHQEAVRELLEVDILYAYPQWSAAALYEAGRCFQEMGSPIEARRQFEKVRHDHPESRWARLAGKRLEELSTSSLPGHEGEE